jgi:hypothetical protein
MGISKRVGHTIARDIFVLKDLGYARQFVLIELELQAKKHVSKARCSRRITSGKAVRVVLPLVMRNGVVAFSQPCFHDSAKLDSDNIWTLQGIIREEM